jgi:hypothetical protein
MAFTRYTNESDILTTTMPTYGLEFAIDDLNLLKDVPRKSILDPKKVEYANYATELHIYSPTGEWIAGNHNVNFVNIPDGQQIAQHLQIDLKSEFKNLNITRGAFKIAINYHHNWVGNEWNAPLYISEISPDRTELVLSYAESLSSSDSKSANQIMIADSVLMLSMYLDYIKNSITSKSYFAINFGYNNIFKVTNIKFDAANNIIVKLYKPLGDDYTEKQRLWLVSQVTNPYIDNVNISSAVPSKQYNTLKNANFDLDYNYGTSTETDFKTWNDLLDTTTSTSQQIIDGYFSGSLDDVRLGIDYTDFNNFIQYSSATERLSNFKFKLELIEYYDTQLNILNLASGSDSGSLQNNIITNQSRKSNVIGGFDAFERWMYNEPTASLFTHGITGSLTPWPKYIQSGSWKLHHTTSSLGEAWYNGYIQSASIYDIENADALVKTIPEYVRTDDNNDQFVLFVNMIGHHYDILWTYINKLTSTYTVEEHPKLGVSKDLLYDVASSLGWQLTNGKQAEQLWQYKLGTNQSGSYQSTGSMFSKSGEDITHEVWRRIVNNMPYILKTKGTARSIKALMSAYGIPNTLLSIREYGGPKVANTAPRLTEERFAYALRMNGSSNIEIQRNYLSSSLGTFSGGNRPPDTTEFRFRPSVTESMSLLSCANNANTTTYWNLAVEHTASYSGSGEYGRLVFYFYKSAGVYDSAATEYVPIYNGDFWNVRIWTENPFTSSTNIPIYIQTARSSDIVSATVVHAASASLTPTVASGYSYWAQSSLNNRTLFLGGKLGSSGRPHSYIGLSGSVQEYREWMEILTQAAFNEHVLSPTSYVGSNATSSYDTLVRQYTLGSDTMAYDHTVKTVISSSHPNQNISDFSVPSGDGYGTYATASGFTSNPPLGDHYNRVSETYHSSTPSLGASNIYSQKIRLEDSVLISKLDPVTRAEVSSYDTAPVDSNNLGLFYSPQDQINKDIFDQIGDVDVDDYFGSPADEFEQTYPQLINFAQHYWKKYTDRNDLNAYIRIFSLFDFALFSQIKQLLPARVNARMGVLIEPNVFERAKVQLTHLPEITNPQYDATLYRELQGVESEYIFYSASIDDVANTITADSLAIDNESAGSIVLTNGFLAPLMYNPDLLKLTVEQLWQLYNSDPDLYAWLGLPWPITGPVYIDQPLTNYYTSNSLDETSIAVLDISRPSYYFDKVIYHYSSSASWATSSLEKALDIANKQALGQYYSRSLSDAAYRDDEFAGYAAANYLGSRMTGLDFNVNSIQTVDGGPVVSFTVVNPNTFKVADYTGGAKTFSVSKGFTFNDYGGFREPRGYESIATIGPDMPWNS